MFFQVRLGVLDGTQCRIPTRKRCDLAQPRRPTAGREDQPRLGKPAQPAPVAVGESVDVRRECGGPCRSVKGKSAKTGYDRDLFEQPWSDDVSVEGGHNGCDTRNDVLRRDLTEVVVKPGSRGCTVLTGTLQDPYTDQAIAFTRGQTTSAAVQIDHVVALADAWQKGAQNWSATKMKDFANDPLNLQATEGRANQQKGAGDAATWLPSNKSYRCTYVSRQVEVKAAYGLWMTKAEKSAVRNTLLGCR